MLRFLKSAYRGYRHNKFKKSILNSHHDVSRIAEKTFDARKYDFSLAESSILNLNDQNYKEYITTWEAYQPRINESRYFVMSDDKYVFSMTFGKYIEVPQTYAIIENGKLVAVSEEISDENLYSFLVDKNGGVIKDRCGYNGYGIYVFKVIDNNLTYNGKIVSKEELSDIVADFKAGIVQSSVEQGSFENELFSGSVNTIRIISMKKKNEDCHEIVAAVQRIGTKRSAPVDNFSQGGGSALINIETGEIGAMTCIDSFDKNDNRVYFNTHPDSGAQIKGKTIPKWNEIKKEIVNITRKIPYFPIIAWDIAVKDDGIAVIEINMKSSLNIFQVHGGMRNEYLGQKYKEHGYIKE